MPCPYGTGIVAMDAIPGETSGLAHREPLVVLHAGNEGLAVAVATGRVAGAGLALLAGAE